MNSVDGRWTILLSAGLLLAGCRSDESRTPATQDAPVEAVAERGPVKVVARAEHGRVLVGDRVNVTLTVTAPEGIEIHLPPRKENLGKFAVRDVQDHPDVPQDGNRRWQRRYSLEIFESGEPPLPEFAVSFVDRRPSPDGKQQERRGEVRTKPLTMEVASVAGADADPTKFRDIKGPVDVTLAESKRRWLWAATAAVVAAAAAAYWLWRRRQTATTPTETLLPHEWAMRQLRRLRDERLPESGRLHEYYFRLSDIVRGYIERRFGVMAPERTTDEFLAEARSHPALRDKHQRLLGDFLTACDMVKFALYEPSTDEAEAAYRTAFGFVEQTAGATPAPADGVSETDAAMTPSAV